MEESLSLCKEIGSQKVECVQYLNLGLVAQNQKNYLDAKSHYEMAQIIAREIGSADYEGYALAGLGNTFIGLRQLDIAEKVLRKSISVRKELDESNLVMESRESLARIALERSDITSAHHQILIILDYWMKGKL